ncbi:MAG: DUF192 domain-containing protein [Spirochaetaceae bacterium]|nr:DUF192 domain-containing protein [Spirochaetaceae bacterium]
MISKRGLRRRPQKAASIFILILCALVLGAGVNCRASDKNKEGEIQFAKREFAIEKAEGGLIPIRAELARTDPERSQGLMNRTSLADGEGMLFIFERDQIVSFWMKNTRIPLSIAFILTDGRIIEIRDMQPLDITSISSTRSVRYALEVPQGWFARAGLNVGDYLRLGDFQ